MSIYVPNYLFCQIVNTLVINILKRNVLVKMSVKAVSFQSRIKGLRELSMFCKIHAGFIGLNSDIKF